MSQRRDANLAFHSISDRIKQNFSKWLLIYQRLSIEANDSNFKKVILWQLSQVSWSSKAFFEETSIAKELVLLILRF